MATPASGRRRCACRAVLLPLGDAPVLEQVGVAPGGPRLHEHARAACTPRDGGGGVASSQAPAAATALNRSARGVETPGGGPGDPDPALERLRELARRIGERASVNLMPAPTAAELPPRPWQDLDEREGE